MQKTSRWFIFLYIVIKYIDMNMSNIFKLFILFLLPISIQASVSNGTIESGNKNALVCHSVDCITPTPGIINFLPTGTTPVTISDTDGIDGVAWGNEIGWINFDPTGVEGVTIDAVTGVISGKAWAQVSGWINFSVTGQTVKINTNGEFEGWAWTGGPYGGWIKFDCGTVGACVKTDWRPISARSAVTTGTPTSGSGGSTVPNDFANNQNDVCGNIPGMQTNIPNGYSQDQGGLCLLTIDYCKNIDGIQLTIPSKYVLNGAGQCILLTEDNKSEFIPDKEKMTTDSIETYVDFCPNLFGLQSQMPIGYVMYEGDCVPEEIDYCSNILGNQYEVPANMKISDEGQCVKMTKQEMDDIEASNGEGVNYGKNNDFKVLAFSFIPDFFRIPFTIPFSLGLFGVTYQVDLLSLFILLNIIFGLILFLKNRIKN
jgi:hypothetical protein